MAENLIWDLKHSNSEDNEQNKKKLQNFLLAKNLVCLLGSGASFGKFKNDTQNTFPSMGELLEAIKSKTELLENFNKIAVKEKKLNDEKNLEVLLSKISQLSVHDDIKKEVENYINEVKCLITTMCTKTINFEGESKEIPPHLEFLRKLHKRGSGKDRLKIFTTNYDTLIEQAAAEQNIVIIDGFSFTSPRKFSPRNFKYDIIQTESNYQKNQPIYNLIKLYKIHGSVNWQEENHEIIQKENPNKPCIIYPSSTKYQLSYQKPYFEMMSQFNNAMATEETCLLVIGFSFSDDHIFSAIKNALTQDTTFKMIIVAPDLIKSDKEEKYPNLSKLKKIALKNEQLFLINATFKQFANAIPKFNDADTESQKLELISKILDAKNDK